MERSIRILCLVVFIIASFIHLSDASCADGGPDGGPLCCLGKDNDCTAEGYQIFARSYGTCYCDTACVNTRDCCTDFDQACPAVDCEVSPWSLWSGCSERCGVGYSERRRFVLREPQNAGAKCPKLQERRGCKGYRGCELEDIPGNNVAMILPYKYSLSRAGPQWEHPLARAPRFDTYCVYFKFRRFHPTCETPGIENWTDSLKKGSRACVECNRPAYGTSGVCNGEGINKKKTRWSAVDIQGCRGVWQRIDIIKDCTCGEDEENRFVFV